MSAEVFELILPEGPGPNPLPPKFTTAAYLKMVNAEVAAAIANGTLAKKIGKFEEIHGGAPFVWDDEIDALLKASK